MRTNRSAPDGPIIPVLSYPDVEAATAWLAGAFGFRPEVLIGPGHRAQLSYGAGDLIVADTSSDRRGARISEVTASTMVRVVDVDAVFARALGLGATALEPPQDHAYGERQASIRDPWNHTWTLTRTVRDVDPVEWGGVVPVTPGDSGDAV